MAIDQRKKRKSRKPHCPLVGAGARMTRTAFAGACKREQGNWTDNTFVTNVLKPFCHGCPIGADVLAGREFAAPAGIDFIDIKQLIMEKNMQEDKNGAKEVPIGNWRTMTYEEAKKLQPTDLLRYWTLPPLKAGQAGTCPNCRRPGLKLASFGICGACRTVITPGMHGIEMLAALAEYGFEIRQKMLEKSRQMIDMETVSQDASGLDGGDELPAGALPAGMPPAPDMVEPPDPEKYLGADKTFYILPAYESLADVLQEAIDQAQHGKGRERHAGGNESFDRQKICEITRRVGLGYPLGQAIKKAEESLTLGGERGVAELLGAINYLAAAVICSREN